MWEDPIVEEVREAGAKLAKKCNYDLKKFAQMLRDGGKRSRKLEWKFVSPNQNKQKLTK